jgi:hypothetical protein
LRRCRRAWWVLPKARPGLLNEIKESPCAATDIKKPQFALIASNKCLMELRQAKFALTR